MHTEALQLIAYPCFFLVGGCIIYLLFRVSPHFAHEAHNVPAMFLAMMAGSLLATALFDLVLFVCASFQFSRLRFVGPIAYAGFLPRPSAMMVHLPIAIVGLWFGARWFSNHQGELPSPKSHKMEY
jgi:hypothetical protein